MFVQKVTSDLILEVLGQSQRTQVSIDFTILFFVLILFLSSKFEEAPDHVDEVTESHATDHLKYGNKKALEVV